MQYFQCNIKLFFYFGRWTLMPLHWSAYNEYKDAKETARYKWVLVVTELFNTAVIDFDAMKTACCSRELVVTKLVVSGTQCNFRSELVDVLYQILDQNEFEELKIWQKGSKITLNISLLH